MSDDMRDTAEDLDYEEMDRARGPYTAGDSRVEHIQKGMDHLQGTAELWLPSLKRKCKEGFKDTERD